MMWIRWHLELCAFCPQFASQRNAISGEAELQRPFHSTHQTKVGWHLRDECPKDSLRIIYKSTDCFRMAPTKHFFFLITPLSSAIFSEETPREKNVPRQVSKLMNFVRLTWDQKREGLCFGWHGLRRSGGWHQFHRLASLHYHRLARSRSLRTWLHLVFLPLFYNNCTLFH